MTPSSQKKHECAPIGRLCLCTTAVLVRFAALMKSIFKRSDKHGIKYRVWPPVNIWLSVLATIHICTYNLSILVYIPTPIFSKILFYHRNPITLIGASRCHKALNYRSRLMDPVILLSSFLHLLLPLFHSLAIRIQPYLEQDQILGQ